MEQGRGKSPVALFRGRCECLRAVRGFASAARIPARREGRAVRELREAACAKAGRKKAGEGQASGQFQEVRQDGLCSPDLRSLAIARKRKSMFMRVKW